MQPAAFGLTFDYRCPVAATAHDHVLTALDAGADWDVRFVAVSLRQLHVADGEPDVWDRPDSDTGLLALQVGVAVRDRWPDRFRAAHRALFDVRRRHGRRLTDVDALRDALVSAGVDPDPVFAAVATGDPLRTIRDEHEAAVADHGVWGVPTFLVGDDAVFVRLLDGPDGDAAIARTTVERILGLAAGWPELNEFKHTRLPK